MKIAIAQYEACYLDLEKGLDKMLQIMTQAKNQQADLVAFGETWLGGYPAWLDHCSDIAIWDNLAAKNVFKDFYNNAIALHSTQFNRIVASAKKLKINLLFGANERVPSGPGNGSIYNSFFLVDKEGKLRNHHRKLMPTYTEKLYYAQGDGNGLQSTTIDQFKIGGLICWEHWMPLARMAMHNQGEHIHFALWPTVHEKHLIASQQYAFEARCFVVACGQIMQTKNIPDSLKNTLTTSEPLLLSGGSCILNPKGDCITQPLYDKEQLILQELELDLCIQERMTLDVSGHYQRPDIFKFKVKKQKRNV